MSVISINGTEVKPTSYTVNVYDITKAERDAVGTMHIDLIATKRKIELKWSAIEASKLQTILSAMSSISFSVSYTDPQEGTKSGMFYKGDRNAPLCKMADGKIVWQDVTVNLIEL